MPLSRHRRGLRVYDDCFSGAEAVAWLHQHLCHNPNFSDSVSRDQTTALLKKFVRCGLLEDAVNGESGYSLQFRERGLYRFGSMSPLKALRTPGRSSCSDVRASTRRLRAAQDCSASPPLPDNKVSKTERNCDSNDSKLSPNWGSRTTKLSSPDPKCQFNDSDHVSKALNVLGVSKTTYNQFKESDKENFNLAQSKLKAGKLKHSSFKVAPKRLALQTIENTTTRPERNINAALINNRKTPANVYVPLSEVRKNFCSHDKASQKLNSCLIEKGGSEVHHGNDIESTLRYEVTHKAINTLTEVSNELKKAEKLPKATERRSLLTSGEIGSEPAPSMRSRAKSFLYGQSTSSKYPSLISKFGEPVKHGNSVYASAKTISPKLLHSVTSNPQSMKMTSLNTKCATLQSSNALEGPTNDLKGNTDTDLNLCLNLDAACKVEFSEMNGGNKDTSLDKECSKNQPCIVKQSVSNNGIHDKTSGQSELQRLMPTKDLTKTTTVSPAVEQRAFVEAWLEIMEDLMYGCPLTLPRLLVHGETLRHNQQQVSRRGVVLVPPEHPDDLPNWVLAAMRFLAHWPSSSASSEEGCGVPNYPGVELDVYRMVKDYFAHQPSPVIPAPLATALLEIITAMEFLDISFRDPRDRFSLRRQGETQVQNSNANAENSELVLSGANRWENKANVPLGRYDYLSEGTVSVFATLPRGTGSKCKKKESEIIEVLEKQDSVEDLMLNMSIGRGDQSMQSGQTASHARSTLDKETGPHFLNASYDLACNHSPSQPPASCVEPISEPVWCSERATGVISQPSHGSCSNDDGLTLHRGFSKSELRSDNDVSRAEKAGLGELELKSPSSLQGSRHVSQSPVDIHRDLQQLSSTNISHIERFTAKEGGAMYVSGDDVRRRKTKRRFFSVTSKKKDESSTNRDVDLRRFSIYESLHSISDDDAAGKDVYSSVEETKRSRSSGFLGSRKRSYSTRQKAESIEHNTAKGESLDVDIVAFSNKMRDSCTNIASDCQKGTGNFSSSRSDVALNPVELDPVNLPPNSCFETAFTSDSPRTRIIPQKSVDTLHLGQLKRRRQGFMDASMVRPKSIAVLPGNYHYGEFVPQSLQHRNMIFGSISCDNSPLYMTQALRSEIYSPKASSTSNIQYSKRPQMECEFKAPPPPPRRKYSASPHESSFSKSHSTGDLNAAQDWLLEGQLQRHDSRGESRLSVDTERSGYSVTTIADGRSSAGPSKSRSLVHKVRDSLRRKKAKIKENVRYKKANLQDPLSSAHSSNQGTPVYSPLESRAGNEAQASRPDDVLGQQDGSHDVHFSRVVSSERGHAVHQRNVDTLKRLRSTDGGFSYPSVATTPLVHRTKSGGFVNLGLLSPSADEIMSISSGRDSALPRSASSPFTASSTGDLSDLHSMASASTGNTGYVPATRFPQADGSEEAFPGQTKTCVDVPSLSPFAGWSSVTTTNYCTNLSTHYASNHQLVLPDFAPTSNDRDACSPFEGTSSVQNSELQSSLASTPLPQPLSSRSNSLSSLYTTALTCYDESDPHPFTATHLHSCTPTPSYPSLKDGSSTQRSNLKLWQQEDSDSGILESQFSASGDSKVSFPFVGSTLMNDDKSSLNDDTSWSCQGYPEASTDVQNAKVTGTETRDEQNIPASEEDLNSASNSRVATKTHPFKSSTNYGPYETDLEESSLNKIHESIADENERRDAGGNNSPVKLRKITSRDSDWQEAPRVYTPEGIHRLQVSVQLLLLLLQPVARRRLHLLLRLLHKMSNNDQLHLSPSVTASSVYKGASTRQVVLDDLSWCVVRGGDSRWRRLITLLVDHHHSLLAPSSCLADAVQLCLSKSTVPRSTTLAPLVQSSQPSTIRALVKQPSGHRRSYNRKQVASLYPLQNRPPVDAVKQISKNSGLRGVKFSGSAGVENVRNISSNGSRVSPENADVEASLSRRKYCGIDGSVQQQEHFSNLGRNHENTIGKKTSVTKDCYKFSECINKEKITSSNRPCSADCGTSMKISETCLGSITNDGSLSHATDDQRYNSSTDYNRSGTGCCHSDTSCNSHSHNIGSHCTGTNKSYNSHCHYKCHSSDRLATRRYENSLAENANNFNTARSVNKNDVLRAVDTLIRYESDLLCVADNNRDRISENYRSLVKNDSNFIRNSDQCHRHSDHELLLQHSTCRASGTLVKNCPLPTGVSTQVADRPVTYKNEGLHQRFADEMQVDLDEGYDEYSSVGKPNSGSCSKGRYNSLSSGPYGKNASAVPRSTSARDLVEVYDGSERCARAASYCVQVDAAEWQRQRSLEHQEQHLLQLLQQIVNDVKLSRDAKKTKIAQFAGLYPKVYEENTAMVPEDLRPSSCGTGKKRNGRVLKSMLRLASWSHLTKQRSSARL
ncbi:DEP domain [Trinorchestia longiramus]|nr:DEP domain [Trinorchestia longiramus]